jgi:enolase-phosphatase E1
MSSRTTASIRHILLDIEGTVLPIAFVHDVLFPYARLRVEQYLTVHFGSSELLADLDKLRQEHFADVQQEQQPPPLIEGSKDVEITSLTAYLHWLIDRDRKSTGLKSLQGKIWKEGYRDGTLKAELFEDVARAMRTWRSTGLKISIFSSGSKLAQQLLFAHTNSGDLTSLINSYFDTTIGPKTGVESYQKIASSLELPAREILFISDVVAELDAAGAAELQTILCMRPGNHPQPDGHRHRLIHSFNDLES